MDKAKMLKALMQVHLRHGATKASFERYNEFKNKIKYEASDSEILIYGLIVPEDIRSFESEFWGDETFVSGKFFRDQMARITGDVTLRINSDGGDAFEASSILQTIAERQKAGYKVNCVVDGIAASAASLVSSSCDHCTIAQMGMIMIHCGSSFVYGNAEDLRVAMEFLTQIDESAVGVYSSKTGKKSDAVLELMKSETYMNADKSVEEGFADVKMDKDDSKSAQQSLEEYAIKQVDMYHAAMMIT